MISKAEEGVSKYLEKIIHNGIYLCSEALAEEICNGTKDCDEPAVLNFLKKMSKEENKKFKLKVLLEKYEGGTLYWFERFS